MKVCAKCNKEKDETQFYSKGSEKRVSSMCRECFNLYCSKRWNDRKKRVVEQFGGKCGDCGNSYPQCVYDFHHLDPSTKDMNWNKMRLVSEDKLQRELAKCVMLCANCHRLRHDVSD